MIRGLKIIYIIYMILNIFYLSKYVFKYISNNFKYFYDKNIHLKLYIKNNLKMILKIR